MSRTRLDRQPVYGSERYDEDLLLKVPVLLWMTLVFCVRHLLLLGITFLPTTGEEIEIFRNLIRPEFLVADLPAAAVLLAGFWRRRPCPGSVSRIWRRGREIITVSIVLYLGLLIRHVIGSVEPLVQAIDEPLLMSSLLSLAALAYVWRSSLVADVLRDCPGRLD